MYVQKVMSRISCHTVYDIYTMLETLQGLDVTLTSQVLRYLEDAISSMSFQCLCLSDNHLSYLSSSGADKCE